MEWEYAARGGKDGRYPWGNESIEGRANCGECGPAGGKGPVAVASFKPNGFGVVGMAGNVWQWVGDKVTPDDPTRAIRGGSWNNPERNLRVMSRNITRETNKNNYIGFRVCLDTAMGRPAPQVLAATLERTVDAPLAPALLATATVTLTKCEGDSKRCSRWEFHGDRGTARDPDGNTANLGVELHGTDQLTIRRVDSSGKTTLYRGKRLGSRLEGDFGSPGDPSSQKHGTWTATLDASPERVPAQLRECTTPDHRTCWTFTWRGDHFDGRSDAGLSAYAVVESFLPASVIIRVRHPSGLTAMLAGRMSSGKDQIVDGEWRDGNGSTGRFAMAWDDALGYLPAAKSVAEDVRPPGRCFYWFTGLVCP